MAHADKPIKLHEADIRPLQHRAAGATRALFAIGAAAVLVALIWTAIGGLWAKFGYAYVVAFAFVLSLGLGSLFFVMVTHLFRAGWVVAVRRPAEHYAATLPYLAIALIPILIYVWTGTGVPYPWAQPISEIQRVYDEAHHGGHGGGHDTGEHAPAQEHDAEHVPAAGGGHAAAAEPEIVLVADPVDPHAPAEAEAGAEAELMPHDEVHAGAEPAVTEHKSYPIPPEMIQGKRAFLFTGFFTLRWVIYFVIWGLLGYFYWSKSIRQDHDGAIESTLEREKWAPPGLILFGVTITFASIDLLMSLDPVWFSTMWGVYYFAGSFLGTSAMMVLTLMGLQSVGLCKAVTTEHYHDLGKLMFAFTFFWGYIAFSQYMLIWYGNIPEETLWFQHHGITTVSGLVNSWTWVGVALLFGHLLIPFAGLMSRHVKRNRVALGFWAVWVLIFHALDLWWVVMPNYGGHGVEAPILEILLIIGLVCLFLGGALYRAALHPLVPVRDPRLHESLAFENI